MALPFSTTRWRDIVGRLRIRVLDPDRGGASPLARPLGRRLALDIVIDVGPAMMTTEHRTGPEPGLDAVVRPTATMLDCWCRPSEDVWRASKRVMAARPFPAPTSLHPGPMVLIAGSDDVGGLMALPRTLCSLVHPMLGTPPALMVAVPTTDALLITAVDQHAGGTGVLAGAAAAWSALSPDPLPPTLFHLPRWRR